MAGPWIAVGVPVVLLVALLAGAFLALAGFACRGA